MNTEGDGTTSTRMPLLSATLRQSLAELAADTTHISAGGPHENTDYRASDSLSAVEI